MAILLPSGADALAVQYVTYLRGEVYCETSSADFGYRCFCHPRICRGRRYPRVSYVGAGEGRNASGDTWSRPDVGLQFPVQLPEKSVPGRLEGRQSPVSATLLLLLRPYRTRVVAHLLRVDPCGELLA